MKEIVTELKNKLRKEWELQKSTGVCKAGSCSGCKYYTDTGKILMYGEEPVMVCFLSSLSTKLDKLIKLSEKENKK